jgi:hypothetical protein
MIALATSPALAPGKAAPYVIAAYIVFIAVLLIYLGIMAKRLVTAERELAKLNEELAQKEERELEEALG